MAGLREEDVMVPSIDISGHQFGEWTAVVYAGNSMWLCRCSCGVERNVRGSDLRKGASRCCGAAQHKNLKAPVGSRWGKLVVVDRLNKKAVCMCDCGGTRDVYASQLTSGQSVCCGCTLTGRRLQRLNNRTHRKSRTITWNRWMAMKNRVLHWHPSARTRTIYHGLEIEQEWLANFESFLADMGECPPGHSLDRIDGSRGYVRGNCRWADIRTQNGNRKS